MTTEQLGGGALLRGGARTAGEKLAAAGGGALMGLELDKRRVETGRG
ncbi:hypothetical protein [Nocardia araoensis]|nr:hypothetical protein [Nocardia araoensis]